MGCEVELRDKTNAKERFVLVSFLICLWIFGCQTTQDFKQEDQTSPVRMNLSEHLAKPYVVLVSIDGFRSDYIERYQADQILKIGERGIRAQSLVSVFPSLTFPNHYSIITGRYPENHQLVSNTILDKKESRTYKIGDSSEVTSGHWYEGEPIWVVAERAGMLSASFYWVGSEAPIHGVRPTYFKSYDESVPHRARMEQIVRWLELPAEHRPHFLTLYFSSIDSAGHRFGPESEEVRHRVAEINRDLGILVELLSQIQLPINLIVVSDHGMVGVDPHKVIALNQLVDDSQMISVGSGAVVHLFLKGEKGGATLDQTYRRLRKIEKRHHFQTYVRSKIPDRFHLKKAKRVGDLVLIADPFYYFVDHLGAQLPKASHGWDPERPEMQGIFLAEGPQIQPSSKMISSFENIHIYPFILKMLGLSTPTPYDGQIEVLGRYLVPK